MAGSDTATAATKEEGQTGLVAVCFCTQQFASLALECLDSLLISSDSMSFQTFLRPYPSKSYQLNLLANEIVTSCNHVKPLYLLCVSLFMLEFGYSFSMT